MQYDLQVFVQDYQQYLFVQMIIEKDLNDNDNQYHIFEINDQYHENNNHFLFDVLNTNFLLIVFDYYFLDLNNLLSK